MQINNLTLKREPQVINVALVNNYFVFVLAFPYCNLFPSGEFRKVHELHSTGEYPMNARIHPESRASLCVAFCLQLAHTARLTV